MTRWIPLFCLVGLVDPYTDDLPRRADGYVQGDGESCSRGRTQVRGKPAEEWGDAGKGAACGDDETPVSMLGGIGES